MPSRYLETSCDDEDDERDEKVYRAGLLANNSIDPVGAPDHALDEWLVKIMGRWWVPSACRYRDSSLESEDNEDDEELSCADLLARNSADPAAPPIHSVDQSLEGLAGCWQV